MNLRALRKAERTLAQPKPALRLDPDGDPLVNRIRLYERTLDDLRSHVDAHGKAIIDVVLSNTEYDRR